MELDIDVRVHVSIARGLANVHEICAALAGVRDAFVVQLGRRVLEGYQEFLRERLCSVEGWAGRRFVGRHGCKGDSVHRCRCRQFTAAGWRRGSRRLKTDLGEITFPVGLVRCRACGRRVAPLLTALELRSGQRRTDQLVRLVTESIAETSYRRGSDWAEAHSGVPIAKSTAHRWAASVGPNLRIRAPVETLMADGTGFKHQPGQRGEVRLVLGISGKGRIRPMGVWAGTSWEDIAKEVRDQLRGRPRPQLLATDGEDRIEQWLGPLVERVQRCQWHFVRESTITGWKADLPKPEREALQNQLKELVSIEIPASDVEMVEPQDRVDLRERIRESRQALSRLASDFDRRGYARVATYLNRAKKQLFAHLELWLETGIVGHRTTSIIECMIRELARRLKKIGWNWSDAGATRLGRIVMIRRYDGQAWEDYWRERLNLHDRCQMHILWCRKAA